MRIELYARSWNDAHMLPFFFRHYDPLVAAYFVYDDGSTDGTLEALAAHPKVVVRSRPPYADPSSHVGSSLALLDSIWKESRGRADWVIVTDIDEHLHHRDLDGYLGRCRASGVTLIPALGFQMISEVFPAADLTLSHALTQGAPFPNMNKLSLFSPDAIERTNFTVGRHAAAPTGRVLLPPSDELMLLHYKYMGFEHTQRRHEQYQTRRRATDLARGWGHKYGWSRDELRRDWLDVERRALDVATPGFDPAGAHPSGVWWRRLSRAA